MTVHSFLIFDRRGKTIFSKRYFRVPGEDDDDDDEDEDASSKAAMIADQHKLIYGMLLSIKEMCGTLSPPGDDDDENNNNNKNGDVQLIKTGAATLYNLETVSGLRFVLYTTAETSVGKSSTSTSSSSTTSSTLATTAAAAGGGVATAPASAPVLTSTGGGIGITNNNNNNNTPLITTPPSSNPNNIVVSSSSNSARKVAPNTTNVMTHPQITAHIRASLSYVYEHLWVQLVVRSPLYQPHQPNFLQSTNFETALDQYLKGMPWFR